MITDLVMPNMMDAQRYLQRARQFKGEAQAARKEGDHYTARKYTRWASAERRKARLRVKRAMAFAGNPWHFGIIVS